MGNLKRAIATFLKAQCSAIAATAVDFTVTLLLKQVLGLWYGYATFIGAVSGGAFNCFFNYRWVFHTTGMKKRYLVMRYVMVWGVSIFLNTTGTTVLTELTHCNFVIVKAVVAAMVAVLWNYQMQRTFVFHHNRHVEETMKRDKDGPGNDPDQ